MSHANEKAQEGYAGLKARDRRVRLKVVKASLYGMFVLLTVVGMRQVQQRWQEQREQMWASAPATIEQTRPLLATESQSVGGGAMLYKVEVLVRYRTAAGLREDWVTVRQIPKRLAEIEVEAIRWKGALCTVRWNRANLRQIDVEVS